MGGVSRGGAGPEGARGRGFDARCGRLRARGAGRAGGAGGGGAAAAGGPAGPGPANAAAPGGSCRAWERSRRRRGTAVWPPRSPRPAPSPRTRRGSAAASNPHPQLWGEGRAPLVTSYLHLHPIYPIPSVPTPLIPSIPFIASRLTPSPPRPCPCPPPHPRPAVPVRTSWLMPSTEMMALAMPSPVSSSRTTPLMPRCTWEPEGRGSGGHLTLHSTRVGHPQLHQGCLDPMQALEHGLAPRHGPMAHTNPLSTHTSSTRLPQPQAGSREGAAKPTGYWGTPGHPLQPPPAPCRAAATRGCSPTRSAARRRGGICRTTAPP